MLFKLILAGAAIAFASKALKKGNEANTFSKTFDYNFTVKNLRFEGFNLVFNLDISLLNPSNLAMSIQNPLIILMYKNEELTRSTYNIPEFSIKAKGETKLSTIEFRIRLFSKLTALRQIFGQLLYNVSLLEISKIGTVIQANKEKLYKELTVKFTGHLNGSSFVHEFNLA